MITIMNTMEHWRPELNELTKKKKAREGAAGEATAAAAAATAAAEKKAAFEAKEAAAATLRTQYEAATAEEKKALEEQKKDLEREEAKFRREMQQQDEDRARAEAQQARREEEDNLYGELDRAFEERKYFEDLMNNYSGKLEFFNTVYGVLPEGEDGENIRQQIDTRMPGVYDLLDTVQAQYLEVDQHVSDLNFQLFMAQQRWDAEDEAAFMQDVARVHEQKADYDVEKVEL